MPKTIYVVTHPEATHHVERLVGGWYDSVLTANGRRHAQVIARVLRARIPSDVEAELFSSDSLRARATAEAIGESLGAHVIADPRLREKSYGIADGRPQGWLDTRFVPPPRSGERLVHDEGISGAETKADFAARVFAAMAEITASDATHQVIVTHGFTLTFIIAAWIGMPLSAVGSVNFRAEPGSVSTLHEDDHFHNRQVSALAERLAFYD